jgi:23S rRNA pseudouridine1911/1915/1917 synthase
MSGAERHRLVVEAPQPRIDAFLADAIPGLSRSRVTQLLEQGCVLVNGRVPRKSYRPAPGDVVEVEVPAPVATAVEPEPIPLAIIHEDADLLVPRSPRRHHGQRAAAPRTRPVGHRRRAATRDRAPPRP